MKAVGGYEAWMDLLIEYAELVKTDKSNNIFECWLKICLVERRIDLSQSFINILKDTYLKVVAEELANLGFRLVQDVEEPEYSKQITIVENQSKSLVVTLNQLYNDYNRLAPADGNDAKRTDMDFEKELAVLAKNGYKINKNKHTVFEFCAALNAYLDENKKLKR